ncbi:MAG TPA: hypothetical protein VK722_03945 [Candidatus Aquilonibacter sp.]|nr:hypothetical protein [Candidatus Aquilonibacter sp.]
MTETQGPERSNITCPICEQPINVAEDYFADEHGKAVHESCYLQRLVVAGNKAGGGEAA